MELRLVGSEMCIRDSIKDNNLFIEVMNQAVQLDALADDVFGSEAMGLKITFDIENGTMEFKQGPYNIKLNKE